MGNVFSSDLSREQNVSRESERGIYLMASSSDNSENQEFHDAIDELDDREERLKAKEAEMVEFRRQLEIKREQRRSILERHKSEKKELEMNLDKERKAKLESYESNKALRDLLTRNNIEIPEYLQNVKENGDLTETIFNMKEEFEILKSNNNKLRRDLADSNVALQGAYSDIADLHTQNTESIKQINALKEVVAVSKTMLSLRENQLNEGQLKWSVFGHRRRATACAHARGRSLVTARSSALPLALVTAPKFEDKQQRYKKLKVKLSEIERSLADREASMLSSELRQEYERQLQNIRSLRTLYEERARLAEVTRRGLIRELEEQKSLTSAETQKVKELTASVQELEARVDELQETILNKNNQIYTCQDETRGLKTQMSAVNKLFSQVLPGYKNKQDLDTLVHRLEENHGILTHMAENENDSEVSTALPKLLLEIVSQVDESVKENKNQDHKLKVCDEYDDAIKLEADTSLNTTAEEIVQNLPKVWRVLIELLSHQTASEENQAEKITTCYKTIQTNTGPVLVPSVSQTYIRLKDLIVEKLGLVKEVNRMKQLNVHLETRLEEQERRLCLVTNELSKTWHVVGRLRRHHHQLHTHEKILKYELQQKRKLLTELKEELEYCREKWDQAREKNTQSEKDWKKLRAEFSSRNTKSFNNSAESGYSDERPSDESSESNDESEYVTEPLLRSKKKLKKSFETILDSSTDRNLAAEREDPVSDLLDVAELPLDTQDGDDHHIASDSQDSKSYQKREKVCETEDEVGEITHDSCTEDHSTADHTTAYDHSNEIQHTTNTLSDETESNKSLIHHVEILKKISEENKKTKKNETIERFDKRETAILNQSQSAVIESDQIDANIKHNLNSFSTSEQIIIDEIKMDVILEEKNGDRCANVYKNNLKVSEVLKNLPGTSSVKENSVIEKKYSNNEISLNTNTEREDITHTSNTSGPSTKEKHCDAYVSDQMVDFQAILKSVKGQNDRLAEKDRRLQKLESGCSEIVDQISKTVSAEVKLIEKLDKFHDSSIKYLKDSTLDYSINEISLGEPSTSKPKQITKSIISQYENVYAPTDKNDKNSQNTESHVKIDDVPNISNRDSSEPSTSSEVDHEALFAARDLRFKRLEEQTKSLVNKVNKTTDKGVKIHYKLEELHNIYGSESSRAGTPSDNDEKDKECDDRDNPGHFQS